MCLRVRFSCIIYIYISLLCPPIPLTAPFPSFSVRSTAPPPLKRACLAAFPHLGDSYLDSAYSCCSAYEGDWRETFLDGNRGNRSAVLDWTMEVPGQGGEDADEVNGAGVVVYQTTRISLRS